MKTIEVQNGTTNMLDLLGLWYGRIYVTPGSKVTVPLTNGTTMTAALSGSSTYCTWTESAELSEGRLLVCSYGQSNAPSFVTVNPSAFQMFDYGWQTGLALFGVVILMWLLKKGFSSSYEID